MKRAMRRRKTWQRQAAAITAAMMAMSVGGIAYAMPQGEVIRSGKGEIMRQDKDMTVNQDSKRLAIDWSGFDIANDERVTFRQPDKDSVALNRVVGDAASVIDGTLSGNGHVYVINPNGVLFGKNASVDVGSLVASTARISDSDMTNFANADGITMAIPEDSSAKVINAGTIRAEGGLVVLHAAEVENSGTITNPEGTTALAAARNLSLSADTAGKINFTVDGALAKAKALNSGMLKADGGYLVMTARSAGDVMSTVVNNTGTMEAKTLRQNEKGEILLDGGDNGIVELNGTLDASGMEAGQSAGSIKAIGAETHVEDGATLHAIGAVDGGLIETSGDYLEIGDNVDIDAAGKTGKAGEWLLDPLEVVISNSQPSGSSAVTNGNTDGSYNSSNDASGTASRNKTTWVNSNTVNRLLNKGTAVSVQATDANKVASITLDSAINKTSGADTSLTLEAQRNVTVNAGITSTSGALDVNLHSDTDGDGLGAVLINADIATNGGVFTSGNGTTIESGSVGTYFGNQGEMGDRHVTTNGGAINLYGDVAIGLNGGTLTLDTKNKTTGASGAVKVTGTVDSGNSYKRVASGLEGWTDFVKSYYDDVISKDTSSDYRYTKTTTTTTYTVKDGRSMQKSSRWWWDRRYIIGEDGTLVEVGQGEYGYLMSDFDIHTTRTTKVLSYDELSPSQKSDLSSHLAAQSITWDGAKAMAQGATKGTNHTGDTYLATITTALENSLASPPEEYQLIVGGRGSGNKNNPVDRQYPDGYYWVTGPEGMANNGKGTKFAKNDGSAVNNYYVKWNYSYSQDTKQTEKEPNNSGPIVSIGFGTASNWDDVKEGAGTIRGFVQEKNLEHSGLVINAGDSKVDIAGNIGNSVALKNVEIDASDVAIGSGEHYTGIVHSDEGVSITGKNVTVGDRITADTKGVDIQATGNIDVDGITAHEKIKLTTTGESSKIILNYTHNDGSLNTDSQDNDAVVIDVQGKNGSFQNLTTAEKNAIKTGEGGNWKVYSYSPDADTFGTNLNSGINAQWGATSDTYLATNDENRYIFQVQPTVYVTANDMTKVYGEVLTNDNVTTTAEATFVGQDNKEHNVNEAKYKAAFTEGAVSDYYTGNGTFTSEGWAKTATRTGGDKAPASEPENNAIYNIKATSDSYNLTDLGKTSGYADATTKDGGTVEVLRRQINVNGSGSQTYGNATINDWKLTASLTGNQEGVPSDADAIVNDDKLDESTGNLSIKSGSSYAMSQDGHTTAHFNENPYTDAVNMENVTFLGDAGVNYEIVKTQGDLTVNKANLTVNVGKAETVYGTPFDTSKYDYAYSTETGKSLVNGDTKESLLKDLGTIGYDNEAALDGTDGKWTAAVGDGYKLAFTDATAAAFKALNDYDVKVVDGKAKVTPYTITEDDIIAANPHFTTVYGDTTTPVEVKIKGVNGDEEISNTATTTAYIYDENGNPIKTEHVGDTYDIESTLTNSNYQFEGGKTSKVFDNTASVTKANLTVNVGNAETVYGTPFDTSKYDYAYSTETGKSLVNGDTKESLLKDLGTIGYDNEAALDGTDGKWTAAVGDGYKLAFTDATAAAFKALNDYDVKVVDGKAKVTPYTITKKDIVDGNPHFTTVYGDTTTPVEVAIKGVNGDATVGNTATTSAYEYGTDGTPVKTKDVGDKIYDITSVLTNKNYRFEDGSDTKLFANTASVTPADLTIQIGNASTVYGTKFDEKKYGYNYAAGITNGDTEETLNAALGGMNYTNDAALDGTNGKWTREVGNYDLTGKGANSLTNYKVTYLNGTATVTPLNITEDNVNDFITNATYTTVYGSKADFGQAVFTGVNGDGTRELSITGSSALTGNTEGVITKDAAENAYNTVVSLDGLSAQDKKNYGLEDTSSFTFDNSATVEKADLTVSRKGIETVYGTVKKDPGDMTTYTDLVNGDTNDIVIDNGNYGTAYNDELTKTNNVGKYNYKATLNSESDVLRNYNVHDDGTNYVNITPYTITDQEVVNLDGSPLYTTKYGQKDAFGTATFTGVNGDGTYELAITDSSALATAGAGKVTKDVGKNIYDTTVELSEAMNGNYQFADGATSKTFEKTASVTPAELTIKTKDVETEYGTVKTTTSEVEGLVNGDLPTGFIYDYGNYGGAYLDGNTKTNDVNTYHFGTTLSGAEFLKNYTITGGEADVKIDPKDVTFFVSGTGNTLTDVTYTVDPDIDAQLAYGEHVDADYTPGNDLGSNQYGVVAHINGTPIVTGDVAGNYRYNYGGLITLSPTVPTKPDIDPHNPSNLDGSGSWTSNMGNHGVPGVERVAGLASSELPFFKVEAGQVSHYGTYDVAADPDKVRLEPTGKRLPEPNQPKTQYREYTKTLTTTDGTGMFRMVYDGSTFNITPVDDGALALMRMGDVKNNVELSAEALHAGFSEMGILLEDLDGVYVHFDTMA